MRPERRSKLGDDCGERPVEVSVLTSTKSVAGHVDRRPETIRRVVELDQRRGTRRRSSIGPVAAIPSSSSSSATVDHSIARHVRGWCSCGSLEAEQRALRLDSAEVATKRSVGAQHPVARHHDGQRVGGAGGADRPDRLRVAGELRRPARSSPCGRSRSRAGAAAPCAGTRWTGACRAERRRRAGGRRSTRRARAPTRRAGPGARSTRGLTRSASVLQDRVVVLDFVGDAHQARARWRPAAGCRPASRRCDSRRRGCRRTARPRRGGRGGGRARSHRWGMPVRCRWIRSSSCVFMMFVLSGRRGVG